MRVGGKIVDPKILGRSRSQRGARGARALSRGRSYSPAPPVRGRRPAQDRGRDNSQRSVIEMWREKRDGLQKQRVEQGLEKGPQGHREFNLERLGIENAEKVAPKPAQTESLGSSQDLEPKGKPRGVTGTSQT